MATLSIHTAAGQALGYYFQLERAMSWIASAPAGAFIGIETEDDVVVKLLNGETITEQDKSSITTFPFNPSKLDLWKTLIIWLDAIKNDEIDPDVTTFYLITNYETNGSSLAEKIGDAQTPEKIKECIEAIKECINEITGKVKLVANKILTYSDEELGALIKKIVFKGGKTTHGVELQKQIISDLQLVNDDTAINDSIINELYGWLFNEVIRKWRLKEAAFIERDAFIRVKNIALGNYREKLINEQIFSIGNITLSVQRSYADSAYIQQLDKIKCDNNEKIDAICNYLNSSKIKSILATRGWITHKQVATMEDSLVTRWDGIFRKGNILHGDRSPEDRGKLIYYDTLDYNAKIGEFETSNYFLTKGSYHELADKVVVGWHPDYKNLFPVPSKINSALSLKTKIKKKESSKSGK